MIFTGVNPDYEKQREEYHNFLKNCPKDKIFCFDTETAGIHSANLVKFSAVDGNGKTLINTCVKPKHAKEWKQAQLINNISPAMVADAPTVDDIKSQITELWNNASLIVGYNIEFDMKFLPVDNKYQIGVPNDQCKKYCDMMLFFADIYGELNYHGGYKWQKLGKCADYYHYKYKAHDSLEDCRATIYCFNRMIETGDIEKVE